MSVFGTWKLTITSPMGTQHPLIAFSEEAGNVTGTMTAPTGETGTVTDILVDGDTISWKADVNSPMGAMNLAFSATVAGDALAGKVTTPMGSIDISGVRQA